mgnify:CR=1 FL=1
MLDTMWHLVQAWEMTWESLLRFKLKISLVSSLVTVDKSSMGVQRNLLSTIQNWVISLQIQSWSFHITIPLFLSIHDNFDSQLLSMHITWRLSEYFCLLFQPLGHCTSPLAAENMTVMGYDHFHNTVSKYNIPLTYFLPWKPSCFAGCTSLKPPLLVPAMTFLLSFYCFSVQVQYSHPSPLQFLLHWVHAPIIEHY